MTAPLLPEGWRLVLDPRVRRLGRALLSPTGRLLRLGPDGPGAIAALEAGTSDRRALRLGRTLLDAGAAHPLPPSHDASDVTVVVPVKDRVPQLARCLAALSADVLVVDDGSTRSDEVRAVCEAHGARYVHRPNGGPAAARNTALPLLRKDFVAFLDSDCVPPPGWLERLRGHLEDPAVAAVAPRVVGGARSPLDLGPRPALVRPGGEVAYVPTAALLVRRSALTGFDEQLRYGEDVDLVWRTVDAGWQVRYDPSVVVQHEEPATPAARLVRRFRYGTSAAPLAQRHPDRVTHLVLPPWP
ncbi:MAG: mycofactocin biosynthesis glycosyltransferase MftF, partial [Mycobacteriales bacterium]